MIILKSREEIEKIRVASKYAMEVLLYLGQFIKEGLKTIELERLSEEKIRQIGHVEPAFKGYNGYPYCLCVSINEEVVHGMPGERVLRENDIVSLDFGTRYDGFCGDAAITYSAGKISKRTENLLATTESALYKGINEAKEGNRLHDISHAIQSHVEMAGFSVTLMKLDEEMKKLLDAPVDTPYYRL
jgi:methionyl aminopeptidase